MWIQLSWIERSPPKRQVGSSNLPIHTNFQRKKDGFNQSSFSFYSQYINPANEMSFQISFNNFPLIFALFSNSYFVLYFCCISFEQNTMVQFCFKNTSYIILLYVKSISLQKNKPLTNFVKVALNGNPFLYCSLAVVGVTYIG